MIDVCGLAFSYPGSGRDTLCAIDLQVPRGSVFGLLGPNGAGKSTLLNILCGLLPQQRGSVRIDGLSLPADVAAIRRFSALVPQDFAFYPQLTGRENLRFFARVLGLAGAAREAEVARCIAVAQLEKHVDRRAGLYSGGLKRRLNLAIGLLNQPRLLFLDEPTVGVDAQSRHFLLDSIRQLADAGTTVVYTSHYMEEIQLICDRLAIIDNGRIQLAGTVAELLQQSGQLLYLDLAAPLPASVLASLQQRWPALQCDTHGQQLSLAADAQAVAALLDALLQAGCAVEAVNFGRRSRLEDVFLDVTQRQLRD